ESAKVRKSGASTAVGARCVLHRVLGWISWLDFLAGSLGWISWRGLLTEPRRQLTRRRGHSSSGSLVVGVTRRRGHSSSGSLVVGPGSEGVPPLPSRSRRRASRASRWAASYWS